MSNAIRMLPARTFSWSLNILDHDRHKPGHRKRSIPRWSVRDLMMSVAIRRTLVSTYLPAERASDRPSAMIVLQVCERDAADDLYGFDVQHALPRLSECARAMVAARGLITPCRDS